MAARPSALSLRFFLGAADAGFAALPLIFAHRACCEARILALVASLNFRLPPVGTGVLDSEEAL